MLLQRGMFLYLFIFIALIVIFSLSNSDKKKGEWLKNLPVAEQKLYKLEMAVSSSEEELNITLAPKYYQERERYCNSFKEKKDYSRCMQRTIPWWGQKFKENVLHPKEN